MRGIVNNIRSASSIYPGHETASLELAKEVLAPVGQSLDGTVLMRVHRVLELEKRTWTNDTELRRTSHSYPLRFERNRAFSECSSAGNLAAKSQARFRNIMNLFKKSLAFKSSPGHHIFLRVQYYNGLSSDDFEAK